MSGMEEKELIAVHPPAYHFRRAAVCAAVVKHAEASGTPPEKLAEIKARGIYELARGFESLAHQLSGKPANVSPTPTAP